MGFITNVKHALVVGGNGAISQAVIQQLLMHETLQTLYIIAQNAPNTVDSRVIWLPGRITTANMNDLVAPIERPIHFVFIGTGILMGQQYRPEKKLNHITQAGLNEIFSINTFGPIHLIQALEPYLCFDYLRIGVVSAKIGSITDNHRGGWYGYRASKAALNMMLKTLAIEWGRLNQNIAIIALHPGTVDSPLSKPFQKNIPDAQLKTPQQSGKHLLAIIDQSQPKDSGQLFDWSGNILPY